MADIDLTDARTRMTAGEARAALLQAGRDLLADRGAHADPLGIDLASAVTKSGVSRSTAYRIYGDGSDSTRVTFTRDLVASLIEDGFAAELDLLRQATSEIIERNPAVFETGTPAELAAVLREVVRVGTAVNFDAVTTDERFWLYCASLASAGNLDPTPDDDSPLPTALREAESPGRMVGFYRDMCELFGLRLKPGWTYERLEALSITLVIGNGLRHRVNPLLVDIPRPTGPDGAEQMWTASAVMFEGLILLALEMNPRYVAAADISTWH